MQRRVYSTLLRNSLILVKSILDTTAVGFYAFLSSRVLKQFIMGVQGYNRTDLKQNLEMLGVDGFYA